jgi:hypothetical protein
VASPGRTSTESHSLLLLRRQRGHARLVA